MFLVPQHGNYIQLQLLVKALVGVLNQKPTRSVRIGWSWEKSLRTGQVDRRKSDVEGGTLKPEQ